MTHKTNLAVKSFPLEPFPKGGVSQPEKTTDLHAHNIARVEQFFNVPSDN